MMSQPTLIFLLPACRLAAAGQSQIAVSAITQASASASASIATATAVAQTAATASGEALYLFIHSCWHPAAGLVCS